MANKKNQVKKTAYDPTKDYQWKPDDKFVFSGTEFDVLQIALGKFVTGSNDVPSIIRLVNAYNIIQKKIAEGVETGMLTEVVKE